MRKLLIILFLASCGNIPCDENFTIYAKGLCVNPGGYQVNTQNLETALTLVEIYYNQFYSDNPIDLEQLLIENKVTLKYSDHLCQARGITFLPFTDEDGTYYPTRMFVLGWSCWNRNYVTAHEILHVIARHHMRADSEVNQSHMVPNMFLTWAIETETPREETVEHYLTEDIRELCEVTQ